MLLCLASLFHVFHVIGNFKLTRVTHSPLCRSWSFTELKSGDKKTCFGLSSRKYLAFNFTFNGSARRNIYESFSFTYANHVLRIRAIFPPHGL